MDTTSSNNKISLDSSPCENVCPGNSNRKSPLRYKKAISCPTPSMPLSPSLGVRRPIMTRDHRSASDIGRHDPLPEVSCHRRSSFRQSAMSPRANQKKLLVSLKEAAAIAIRNKSAIQLQALARGFLVRQQALKSTSSKTPKIKKAPWHQSNHTHHSMFSEITMSEADDGVSLGSLDWATDDEDYCLPFRQERHGNHKNYNNNNSYNFENSFSKKLQASTSTPETWLESDFGSRAPQDSFSTLLTRESMDVPIQRPHRRRSPLPSPCSPARSNLRQDNYHHAQETQQHPFFHPISPCSFGEPRRKVSCLRDSPYRKNMATNKLLKAAKLHISLSSIDEPVRRPSRASSPSR